MIISIINATKRSLQRAMGYMAIRRRFITWYKYEKRPALHKPHEQVRQASNTLQLWGLLSHPSMIPRRWPPGHMFLLGSCRPDRDLLADAGRHGLREPSRSAERAGDRWLLPPCRAQSRSPTSCQLVHISPCTQAPTWMFIFECMLSPADLKSDLYPMTGIPLPKA